MDLSANDPPNDLPNHLKHCAKRLELVTDIAGLYGLWLDHHKDSRCTEPNKIVGGLWCAPQGYLLRFPGIAKVHVAPPMPSLYGQRVFPMCNFVGTRDQAEQYMKGMQLDHGNLYRVLPYNPQLPARVAEIRGRVDRSHPSEREWASKQAAADVARLLDASV